jgi:phosphomannomutase
MPEISRFFGISIRMYFDDHNPPHFHAFYGGAEIEVGLDPIEILHGRLPRRAMGMVLEWTVLHRQELLLNWDRLHSEQEPHRIDPLD